MKGFCSLIGNGPLLVASAGLLRKHGFGIRGVVSNCEQTAAWCQRHGVPRVAPEGDQLAFLSQQPFDYLFSIVNHSIIAPEILALPRKAAINFHDSPLPDYAGFNAVAWAILDGRSQHGITWHRMTEQVDQGEILVAEQVAINDDDTAFTLATRCGEAALRGFEKLLGKLEADDLSGKPQGMVTNFHKRSQRPGVGLLNWREPARVLERRVRGLDFGPDENWLTTPKLQVASGEVLRIGQAVVHENGRPGEPGTISALEGHTLLVATGEGMLAISELTALDGSAVGPELWGRLGLKPGGQLRVPSDAELADLDELDAQLTRTERFWTQRLAELAPSSLSELGTPDAQPEMRQLEVALPSSVSDLPEASLRVALAAAVVAYVARVGVDAQPVSLGFVSGNLTEAQANLFARVVPFVLPVDPALSWAGLCDLVTGELALQQKRRSFARDVYLRYPKLKEKSAASRSLRLLLLEADLVRLPDGAQLGFDIRGRKGQLSLSYDSRALDEVGARHLLERVLWVLEQGRTEPDRALEKLSPIPPSERELLLGTWQQTQFGYERDQCVHRLFEAQVAKTPDKIALVFGDESLSYAQLNARANAVAAKLQDLGVGPDDLVGVCVARSLEMMIALLGVLKAGGAYVPLDPNYPAERLSIMLKDSRAQVLLTQRQLERRLPTAHMRVLCVEDVAAPMEQAPVSTVGPNHLAYVIFTSGSTGRPKGVMVQHGNVVNFFAGMDAVLGTEPGVWLAVTSISFDISVLELFWTLARGYKVVIQQEGDRASMLASPTRASSAPMGFGLFYFAADSTNAAQRDAYRLLLEGAKFADTHDFVAVWTPERHFHSFGGLYPNPAVTTAALASITSRIELRAGSVVLPLHNPIRVAEDWAVVDNLSGGRVGLSFASGWHVNDFALMPQNFERRREVMAESIQTVLKLWRGEKITLPNGAGAPIEVSVLPRPIRERPPLWVASAGNVDTFKLAGAMGFNVLTNMLGQDLKDLEGKFAAYREARREHGYPNDGVISVMLHTFVCDDDERARELARDPFCNYLASSYDLVKVAPWMFPAFKQPSQANRGQSAFDSASFDDDDMRALLDHAFDRYFETAGLFGTPERALSMVEQLKGIGATEVACLIDFGIDAELALQSLTHLDRLREISNPGSVSVRVPMRRTIAEQLKEHQVTHLQCTPSMARMLLTDGTAGAMGELKALLLGGEALSEDLVGKLAPCLRGRILNMYGPTETTIWSTVGSVEVGRPVTIGRPIANTWIRVLDTHAELCPVGTPGELCIGGAGVVRGYLDQPDLTNERFIADPYQPGERLYRTGDLAKYTRSGELEYLGRLDHQVKLNGYRIELGEIESVMRKHPDVHDAVVVVKGEATRQQLVGYFVMRGGGSNGQPPEQSVSRWGKLWNEAYERQVGVAVVSRRFDTSGWLNSFTGEPYSQPVMREWLDNTLHAIRRLQPRRVVEIGCGTGMLLFACLSDVEHYTGADLSASALDEIRRELSVEELGKVTLLNQAAHELDDVIDASADLVVINSVVQYFPSRDYLTQVLDRAATLVTDGGRVFIGDVRSLRHLDLFHTLVELSQAPAGTSRSELASNIRERVRNEPELLVDPECFRRWVERHPGWSVQRVDIKPTKDPNEMNLFRYDVVLQKHDGEPAKPLDMTALATLDAPTSPGAIAERLAAGPELLLVRSLQNARFSQLADVQHKLASDATMNADALRDLLAGPGPGIDPAQLASLDTNYSVEMRWGANLWEFDALFRRVDRTPEPWPLAPAPDWAESSLSNTPAQRSDNQVIVPRLRKHLRDFLPDYMVPSVLVALEALPLTPNGKVDRKALPEPASSGTQGSVEEYTVPTTDFERTIATIWQSLLGVEKVGTRDNIFDLGASSLLTVEANNLLQAQLGRKIPLVSMFRFPTIEKLATHLSTTAGGPGAADAGRDKRDHIREAAERRLQARSRVRR